MKYTYCFILLCLLTLACSPQKKATGNQKMKLVWFDEFDGTGMPDTSKWSYDLGDGCPDICGWGNNEWQYYTKHRKENARLENGHLIIEARQEKIGTKDYTSARMVTKHKGDWTYGRLEIKAKLPKGRGVWPAIWMLSTDWKYGGWPESGEIDIMEHVGYMPDSIFGSVHTKRFNHIIRTQSTNGVARNDLSTAFHVYGIDWDADKIVFFIDDQPYHTFTNQHIDSDAWPFDQAFHLILNVAVGGNWGASGGVDPAIWPQQMDVDWVRVYAKK
jgi:beta-glucanase (GH16 family)